MDLRQASALTASARAQSESAAQLDAQSHQLSVYSALSLAGLAFVVGLVVTTLVQRARMRLASENSVERSLDNSRIFFEGSTLMASEPLVGDGIDHVGSLGVLER